MQSLVIIFAVLCLANGQAVEKCCSSKSVGGVQYSLVSEGAVPMSCLSACIYQRSDNPTQRYCFARGNLPVTCEDPVPTPDVLFIGPGNGASGESEVLRLPSFITATCKPPVFPHGRYSGYVSTLSPDGPLLCGGTHSGPYPSWCNLLARNGSWVTSPPPIKENRYVAAAVQLQEGWWMTGGIERNGRNLSSTELYDGNTWQSSVDLPKPLHGHCLVKLNSSHVFLAGGHTGSAYSAAAYIYSNTSGFVRVGDMKTPRYLHGCALHGDQVWVGGGRNAHNSTEFYSLSSSTWLPGPALPSSTYGGRMITSAGKLTMIGTQKIWQLETTGLGSVDGGTWVEVAEMKTRRGYFDVIKMKQKDCDNWNI